MKEYFKIIYNPLILVKNYNNNNNYYNNINISKKRIKRRKSWKK